MRYPHVRTKNNMPANARGYLRSVKGFNLPMTTTANTFSRKNVPNQIGTGLILLMASSDIQDYQGNEVSISINGEEVVTNLSMLTFFPFSEKAIVLPIVIPKNADITITSLNFVTTITYDLIILYLPLDTYSYTGSFFIPQNINKTIAIGRNLSVPSPSPDALSFTVQRGRGDIHYLRLIADANTAVLTYDNSGSIRLTILSNGQAIVEDVSLTYFTFLNGINRYNNYIPVCIVAGSDLVYKFENTLGSTIVFTTAEIYALGITDNG